MILNLLHWGKNNGAAHSYLAVLSDNLPALRLYSKLDLKNSIPTGTGLRNTTDAHAE